MIRRKKSVYKGPSSSRPMQPQQIVHPRPRSNRRKSIKELALNFVEPMGEFCLCCGSDFEGCIANESCLRGRVLALREENQLDKSGYGMERLVKLQEDPRHSLASYSRAVDDIEHYIDSLLDELEFRGDSSPDYPKPQRAFSILRTI